MDRGAGWATVHRDAKSWTQLKQISTHTHTHTHTPGGTVVKNLSCNAGTQVLSPIREQRPDMWQSNLVQEPQLESPCAATKDPSGHN